MNLASRVLVAERMETDCVDYDDYRRCLRDLARVNRVTSTHRPMLAWLAREAKDLAEFSLLDVGCGHGDALRAIHRQATARNIRANLTGIDLHPWSIRAAREATPESMAINYVTGDVFTYEWQAPFDFIVSSQVTHHLEDDGIVAFIRWMEAHARIGWFVGDLHRHWFPYYGFPLLARLALWHRFVRQDGQISIGRSFIPADWQRLTREAGLAADAVSIRRHLPFRLCVSRNHSGASPTSGPDA